MEQTGALQDLISLKGEKTTRSVFVGNIPYDSNEEELKEIFSQIGPIISFRMVYDRETGKPKGYGFVEYADLETANSAIRNLNGTEFRNRHLRVDNASCEKLKDEAKNDEQFEKEQETTFCDMDYIDPKEAPDIISNIISNLPSEKIFELLKQIKQSAQENPEETRELLIQNPQLSFAILQSLLILNVIDSRAANDVLKTRDPKTDERIRTYYQVLPEHSNHLQHPNDFVFHQNVLHQQVLAPIPPQILSQTLQPTTQHSILHPVSQNISQQLPPPVIQPNISSSVLPLQSQPAFHPAKIPKIHNEHGFNIEQNIQGGVVPSVSSHNVTGVLPVNNLGSISQQNIQYSSQLQDQTARNFSTHNSIKSNQKEFSRERLHDELPPPPPPAPYKNQHVPRFHNEQQRGYHHIDNKWDSRYESHHFIGNQNNYDERYVSDPYAIPPEYSDYNYNNPRIRREFGSPTKRRRYDSDDHNPAPIINAPINGRNNTESDYKNTTSAQIHESADPRLRNKQRDGSRRERRKNL